MKFTKDDVTKVLKKYNDGVTIIKNINRYEPEIEEILDGDYRSESDFEDEVIRMFNIEESCNNIITIQESVQIEQENEIIILEKGDRIKVLKESIL